MPRAPQSGPPKWFKSFCYNVLHVVARLTAILFYRIRVFGRENWPSTGGALVCANHQSSYDPVLIGLSCERHLSFLAKRSLFQGILKPIIETLNAIPVNRDGTGIDGLKETMRRLKQGEMVLLFPEGTRSQTGELRPIKPGFIAVARKSKVPIVPVVFDGTYQVWPKWQWLPTVGTVHVKIGKPISVEEVAALDDEALVNRLQCEMESLFDYVRASRVRGMISRGDERLITQSG